MVRRLAVHALLAASIAALGAAAPRPISLDQRVAAERAIQEVYRAARSWPEGNPSAKPRLDPALTDEVLRARVIDLLRKSDALSKRWGRPLGAATLGAELQRMSASTQAPGTLAALFAALENDPILEAETLARRAVVEREIRSAYAWDRELHAAVRGRAERAMQGVRTPSDLAHLDADYRESVVRRDDSGLMSLPAGRVTALTESAAAFRAVAILDSEGDALRVATASWPKTTFDAWWRSAASGFAPSATPLDGPVAAATIAADRSCAAAAPWTPTAAWGNPSPRYLHTAVWTGAEMLVWGGQDDAQSLGTGFRYDPATDLWTPITTVAAPKDRAAHSAVWTGSKLIVWGGTAAAPLGDGGVYDPVSNMWQAVSLTGAPSARAYHSAVWTGSKMIVWGGEGGAGTGAAYDPVANSWTPLAMTNAPSDRSRHAAAWTGSGMLIWGGRAPDATAIDTGASYDPAGDVWSPLPGAAAPSARWGHSGSWSGSELWIWGGTSNGSTVLGDGARYRPATQSWTSLSGAGAPAPRTDHRAAWTGTQLFVWGGGTGTTPLGDGARYDAQAEAWLPVTEIGAPAARRLHTSVWTGDRVLVFGGLDDLAARTDGARYDPVADAWSPMAGGIWAPSTRRSAVSISTGAEFLVYGGETFDTLGPEWTATGAVYDPAIDAWRPMSAPDSTQVLPRESAAVWTGNEMIVWGGREPSGAEAAVDRGGRYDPALDAWTSTATAGAPAARSLHSAVWTGTEMIVWGGAGESLFDSGGRYDPATNSWTAITPGGTARYAHTAVWSGLRMLAWGGQGAAGGLGGPAAIYAPGTDSWSFSGTPLPGNDGPPIARINHTAVWNGTRMIVWGGQKPSSSSVKYRDGAAYDPAADRWYATNLSGAPSVRDKHVALWDGNRMIVWGGTSSCCFLSDGGEYDVAANAWSPTFAGGAPAARGQHSAGLVGSAAIVWGGLGTGSRTLNSGATYCSCSFYGDGDGDGYGNPAALLRDCSFIVAPPGYVADNRDCDDAHAAVNPSAADTTCDGIDQNCSGVADEGYVPSATTCGAGTCSASGIAACAAGQIVDSCVPVPPAPELCDGFDNDCDGFIDNPPAGVATLTVGKSGMVAELAWIATLSATSYDIVRGTLGILSGGNGDFTAAVDACVADDQAGASAGDPSPPPAGDGFWYLVRGTSCAGAGSYDEGVPSQSGSRDAEIGGAPLACP